MKDLISEKTWKLYEKVLPKIKPIFEQIDKIEEENTAKVMKAFFDAKVSEADLGLTTGYGYDDVGREKIEKIYAQIFKAESALVRTQFVSGSHTICKTLFGLLRPKDLLLSITGRPYDTLHEVIGIVPNDSSLKSFGINYDEIDLINDDFDDEKIVSYLKEHKVKLILIQRSKGYANRKSLSINKLARIIPKIKEVSPNTLVMVDNCYCELVNPKEPVEVGADVAVGSLIKNLGAGMAQNGGYVVGKRKLINLVAESLTLPGEGINVGPSLGANITFLKGLFFAPSVVASSLKIGVLTSALLEELGYLVSPKLEEEKVDIVTNIIFNNRKDLEIYCEGIQSGSPIDSYVKPMSSPLPGYQDEVIMAAGTFTQGSSIELSCDGPMKEPYIAYQQGGLTYQTGKIGVLKAVDRLIKYHEN